MCCIPVENVSWMLLSKGGETWTSGKKKAAIIGVVAHVQSGSQKNGQKPPKFETAPPAVQSGSVPPYSLVVKNVQKPSNSEKKPAVKFW